MKCRDLEALRLNQTTVIGKRSEIVRVAEVALARSAKCYEFDVYCANGIEQQTVVIDTEFKDVVEKVTELLTAGKPAYVKFTGFEGRCVVRLEDGTLKQGIIATAKSVELAEPTGKDGNAGKVNLLDLVTL